MNQDRFFREVSRLGRKHGLDADLHNDRLHISRDGKPLCGINGKGGVLLHVNVSEIMDFYTDAMDARDYITAMEQAPPLVAEGLGEGYRLLAEFDGVVLAGKDRDQYGFQFITWQRDYHRTGLDHGHYYDSYVAAKEDFAFRSRLALEHHRYTDEQARTLHKVVSNALEQGLYDNRDEMYSLRQCMEKLESSHPELAIQPTMDAPQPEHSIEPSMNM